MNIQNMHVKVPGPTALAADGSFRFLPVSDRQLPANVAGAGVKSSPAAVISGSGSGAVFDHLPVFSFKSWLDSFPRGMLV